MKKGSLIKGGETRWERTKGAIPKKKVTGEKGEEGREHNKHY